MNNLPLQAKHLFGNYMTFLTNVSKLDIKCYVKSQHELHEVH